MKNSYDDIENKAIEIFHTLCPHLKNDDYFTKENSTTVRASLAIVDYMEWQMTKKLIIVGSGILFYLLI